MRARLASLTTRLVLTAVALVVAVSILIGVFATLAIANRLTEQVDDQLREASRFADRGAGGRGIGLPPGPGSIGAQYPSGGSAAGFRQARGRGNEVPLSTTNLDELDDVPADDRPHTVQLTALGSYRVQVIELGGGKVVIGLPTREVDDAVSSLIGYEVGLILVGGLVAAGAALVVVRRQLRPLNEVAATAHVVSELPLSQGEIHLSERVPAHLTDEATEVGQVGAALNRLLEHVEDSLGARHRSEQQVRQFVADASHELRTPLATIVGYTELARRRPDEVTRTTALAKVEEESARMTSLVENLLLLARLDAEQPLVREPVDLTRLLLEAVSDARVVGPDHQWRLELPQESLEVVGDEQRLHQVVTNLLTNARKHTPAGTTVTVVGLPDRVGAGGSGAGGSGAGGSGAGFEVRDDGPGFSPDLAAVAFERFARGDVARERSGGAGLGLALVEAIVTALGGTVALTSAPGDTRVTVRLAPHAAPVDDPSRRDASGDRLGSTPERARRDEAPWTA